MPAPTLAEDWRRHLTALQPDWDTYGAPAITEEAMDALGSFSVVPRCNGGLQLEVHSDGCDIEIEISPSGKISEI